MTPRSHIILGATFAIIICSFSVNTPLAPQHHPIENPVELDTRVVPPQAVQQNIGAIHRFIDDRVHPYVTANLDISHLDFANCAHGALSPAKGSMKPSTCNVKELKIGGIVYIEPVNFANLKNIASWAQETLPIS